MTFRKVCDFAKPLQQKKTFALYRAFFIKIFPGTMTAPPRIFTVSVLASSLPAFSVPPAPACAHGREP